MKEETQCSKDDMKFEGEFSMLYECTKNLLRSTSDVKVVNSNPLQIIGERLAYNLNLTSYEISEFKFYFACEAQKAENLRRLDTTPLKPILGNDLSDYSDDQINRFFDYCRQKLKTEEESSLQQEESLKLEEAEFKRKIADTQAKLFSGNSQDYYDWREIIEKVAEEVGFKFAVSPAIPERSDLFKLVQPIVEARLKIPELGLSGLNALH